MRPDRTCEKEVEFGRKDRRVEPRIEIESRSLPLEFGRCEQVSLAVLNPLARGFDSAIAVRVEETNQPIRDAQTPTSNVEDPRLWRQSVVEKSDELSATTCLERLTGNAQETMA